MRYPRWLPYPRYIIKSFLLIFEAGLAIAIAWVAIILTAIPLVFVGWLGIVVAIATGDDYLSPELTDEQTTALAIVVITIMSYVYHLGGFLFRWQQATFKPKPKPKPARRQPTSKVKPVLSKPMTDIDREIEEMRRKLREK